MVPHVNSSMTSPIPSPYMILPAASIGIGFYFIEGCETVPISGVVIGSPTVEHPSGSTCVSLLL